MKGLLFILIFIIYSTNRAHNYEISLLNPEDVNIYPDSTSFSSQQCKLTYHFEITSNVDFSSYHLTAMSTPNITSISLNRFQYLESNNQLVELVIEPNFGTQGSLYLTIRDLVTGTLHFTSPNFMWSCLTMPNPLVNTNTQYKNWKNLVQDGYYQTYLKLNLEKYVNLVNLAVLDDSRYKCLFEQYGLTVLKVSCAVTYNKTFSGPFGNIIIRILDSVNVDNATPFNLGTFLKDEIFVPTIYTKNNYYPVFPQAAYRDIYLTFNIDDYQDRYFTPVINVQNPYLVKVVAGNPNSKTLLFYYKTIQYATNTIFESGTTYYSNSTLTYADLFQIEYSELLAEPMTLTDTTPLNMYSLYLLQMTCSGQLYDYEVTLSYGGYKKTIWVSYPYGLKSQTNGNMVTGYYANIPNFLNIGNIGLTATGLGKVFYANYHPPFLASDLFSPNILGIEIINIGYQQIIIRVHATDSGSGVYSIVFDGFAQIFPSDIVSGDIFDGIYEIFVDFRNKSSYYTYSLYEKPILVYDIAGNFASLSPLYMPPIQNYPMTINLYEQSVIQLDRVYFSISGVIDVTGSECPNTLFINFTNAHHDEIIRIEFYSIDVTTFGIWDNQYQMYKADFIIPKNLFTGTIPYYVYYRTVKFDSLMFPSTGQLKITSENADRMPPMITNIGNIIEGGSQIGWTLTIRDDVNGFSHGLIKVTSDIDIGNPYIIEFSGNPDIKIQMVEVPLFVSPQCLTQKFTITYIELFDSAGVKSTYNDLSYIKSVSVTNPPKFTDIDPFMTLVEDYTPYLSIFIFSSQNCPADVGLPYFINHISDISLDVTNFNRTYKLTFTVKDDTNPISRRYKPTLYLHAIYFEYVSTQCEPSIFGAGDMLITYSCLFESLPYGFGQGYPIQWTVSGFADVMLNFGYQGTFNLKIDTILSRNYSVIETVSIPTPSGEVIISGKNLGTIENVEITFSNGETQIVPVIEGYNTVIIIEVPMDKNISSIKTVELPSNSAPMPDGYELIPATTCPGTPQCSGPDHGSCTISGCICIGNWGGNDCSLSGVNTPPIIINTTNPDIDNNFNTTLPDGQTVSLRTLLSVISLNELNKNGDDFKIHKFSQWIFSNTTSQSDLKGINEYTYESNITNNNLTTNVKVIIQYFQQKETIFFANQFLDMLPSSIKYKIEISPYSFDSNLNTLKLVMSASIESFDNSECSDGSSSTNSNLEEQDDQNLQYIKLIVNSHSLYGRLIKRGIIDNRIQTISNSVSQDNNLPSGSVGSTIGIHIPNFKKSVLLDPDFSVLLDTSATPSPNNNKNNCETSSKSSKLTKSQLAGIIIGVVGFSLIVTISAVYYFYKRYRDKKSLAQINKKIAIANMN
ncbi:hypothetical protein DLAC_07328 [Tieghemostelium lacteum]|uniref:EGF-like domain-containing protein n=1 Tax=Tieghemostelium lacteum TaxID=361077 RepID=A0A151ZC94_TIELA|nr:hypothetical protein DLAC_07328 [Tieghemostelium lacteum]|eukprot:KYQ91561.1 hypothetical protein DLAC_07328 [Tieghemostelium lacteum]